MNKKPLTRRLRKHFRKFVGAPLVSPWGREKMAQILGDDMFKKDNKGQQETRSPGDPAPGPKEPNRNDNPI